MKEFQFYLFHNQLRTIHANELLKKLYLFLSLGLFDLELFIRDRTLFRPLEVLETYHTKIYV